MKLGDLSLVPRSFVASQLTAFALVIVPLAIALGIAVTQVQSLAIRGEASIARAARLGEQSRALDEALVAMERAARQARVIGAAGVIESYHRHRVHYWTAAQRLLEQFGSDPIRVDELVARERAIFAALQAGDPNAALTQWPELSLATGTLLDHVDAALARERGALVAHPAQVASQVFWVAAAALPLAVALAGLFAWRLGRPVRTLAMAIRRLGDGDLDAPVRVHGPRNIASLGTQLDWLRQRLVDLQSTRRTLLQGVSHDLKTPLAAISEGRALLADQLVGPVTRDQQAVLDLIARNAERLLARIDALVNAGAQQVSRASWARVDVGAVVQRVLADHAFACAARGLHVRSVLPSVAVAGDREQLRMIVDNLVSNAIKYSPDRGTIRIALSRAGQRVELRVLDDGPGVTREEAQRIFAPSARGSAAVLMRAPGSGIGLAVARSLADAHDGALGLDPAHAAPGACFLLELPCAEASHAG